MKAENVVHLPIPKKQSEDRKVITADFTEHDEIRDFIRAIVKSLNKRVKKSCWDFSKFYIGRNVGNLTFFNLRVSEFQMRKVVEIFKNHYSHKVFVAGTNLHIYMRGKKKS